jgi:predicted transcriptional regulator of viral defense system
MMERTPKNIIRAHGGQLRMSEALALGISRYQLYKLRDQGILAPLARGIYRMVELPAVSDPDLVAVSLRFPHAVICLISALAYHHLTTQIPHEISLAVSYDARRPVLASPPVHAYRFSAAAFAAGIQTVNLDGVPIRIYDPEKTLTDCFKFRNKLGMDVVQEALKLYKSRMPIKPDALLSYARICRVERVMTPYLEAML